MKLSFMKSTWEAANKGASMMLMSNVVLALAVGALVVDKMSAHERLVLVPPYIDKAVKVGWKAADAEYMKSFGLYFATLAANVSPKNVTFVADSLSGMVTSRIYPQVRKQLLVLAEDPVFKTTGGSVRFEPDRVMFESDSSKVFVMGNLTTQNAGGRQESEAVTYEMRVEMQAGRPVVDALTHYSGNQPHTLKWLESNPKAAEGTKAAAQVKDTEQ
jgi:conjugal transfer pilus assembly protein TraE